MARPTQTVGNIELDRRSTVTLQRQIARSLRTRLQKGEWRAGDRLPSERDLCETYGVSRITVRYALDNLEREGLISRDRGSRALVRAPLFEAAPRKVASLTKELATKGMTAGAAILGVTEVPGTADLEPLDTTSKQNEPSRLFRIHRLRTADGLPIAVQLTFLPAARFPGLLDYIREDTSLYALLGKLYRVHPTSGTETFRVGQASAEHAPLLQVPIGTPVFVISRIARDEVGLYERTHTVFRGDRYTITINLSNKSGNNNQESGTS